MEKPELAVSYGSLLVSKVEDLLVLLDSVAEDISMRRAGLGARLFHSCKQYDGDSDVPKAQCKACRRIEPVRDMVHKWKDNIRER